MDIYFVILILQYVNKDIFYIIQLAQNGININYNSPGNFVLNSRNYIPCSNCIYNPIEFSYSLECSEDTIQQDYAC